MLPVVEVETDTPVAMDFASLEAAKDSDVKEAAEAAAPRIKHTAPGAAARIKEVGLGAVQAVRELLSGNEQSLADNGSSSDESRMRPSPQVTAGAKNGVASGISG